MEINRYQFDSIASKTKRDITPIRHGEEDGIYFEYLALLETHMHQFHLEYGINGRQAQEILQLVLFDIKSITDGIDYVCTKWEEDCYRPCADTIEALCIPDKNPDLREHLEEDVCLDDDFFEFPRKNLIRVHESVGKWTKELGPDGYFNFIDRFMADEIRTSKHFLIEDRFLISG